MNRVRPLVLATLCCLAAASQAVQFSFNSHGTFSTSGGVTSVNDPNIDFDASDITVTSLVYSYADTDTTSGSGTLNVSGGSIDFAFTGTITRGTNSDALGGVILSFNNGTGVLAGLNGQGSLSNTTWVGGPLLGTDQSTFVANVVPEPASMAVLAIGAIAAMARRRRK